MTATKDPPDLSPVDSASEEDSVYDSADDGPDDEEYSSQGDDSEDGFKDQGSSDEDDDLLEQQHDDDESTDDCIEVVEDIGEAYDAAPRAWQIATKRTATGSKKQSSSPGNDNKEALWMHTDDFSSDDEDDEGSGNRIGRVPLHWYDEHDHIGYNVHGSKVAKSSSANSGDMLDKAIAFSEEKAENKFTVHDALNDRNVALTERQLDLIRRIQGGAYAHPEFDGTPDYVSSCNAIVMTNSLLPMCHSFFSMVSLDLLAFFRSITTPA